MKRVALIATGDEIVQGDILNTNGHYFCQSFIDHGIVPGRQVVVGDDDDEICQAIKYLQPDHDAIITIGGLGPTSDDRTRYGLAQALGLELEFYDEAWQWIVTLLTNKNIAIPDTNRQQALLPKGSEAIFNPNGTAAACYLQKGNKHYFMLPGPPNECRPIFDAVVIKKLLENQFAKVRKKKSWLLLSVSESDIAQKLESLDIPQACTLGYRVSYPYLEVKLFSENLVLLEEMEKQFLPIFHNKLVSLNRQTASQQLHDFITQSNQQFSFEDNITGGILTCRLLSPDTFSNLSFSLNQQERSADILIQIHGLEAYWNGEKPQTHLPAQIDVLTKNKRESFTLSIPFRESRTADYACEMICWTLLNYLVAR